MQKKANASAAESAKKVNAKKSQVSNKKETATQKAARLAEKEKAREAKAAAKAAEKAERKAARAEKLAKQKAETAERHENAKSACHYGFYGVVHAESTATPFAACKHFYLDMQSACGGALCVVLREIIGNDKRDFAERYAERVKAKAAERGAAKFTPFLVWGVLWEDLKQYTRGAAKENAETAAAIDKLLNALQVRQAANKAAREAKAAAKAAKANKAAA